MNKTAHKEGLSVIVPILNERGSIRRLVARIHATLFREVEYEIIVIDDGSEDGSWELLKTLQDAYPLRIYKKKGERGKAHSLREGFRYARYDTISFIDADLQYPPEELLPMYHIINKGNADVVVTDRKRSEEKSSLRKVASGMYRFFIQYMLFQLPYDTQSGLKMFRRPLLGVALMPTSEWNFDIPFLWHSSKLGKTIVSYPISFSSRKSGKSKVNVVTTGIAMLFSCLALRFGHDSITTLQEGSLPGKAGIGFVYHKNRFVTHTDLPLSQSALTTVTIGQRFAFTGIASGVTVSLYSFWTGALIALVSAVTAFYLADLFYMFFLSFRSLIRSPEMKVSRKRIKKLQDKDLPVYSILCPLYKEARILDQFIQAIQDIDWPKDKLDVQLLLEEDDDETQAKARSMNLPSWIKIRIVPDSQPKTKPKACNYGLAYAQGEFIVIYDAEDVPDVDQLKKVYASFLRVSPEVACIQAKLRYYNASQNMLTRLFESEYRLWFGLILPGLQSLKAPIPLGGTSNHFRTHVLEKLYGWDSFNVTEDCDLGIRLYRMGYQTEIIDSFTSEEASSTLSQWLKQRSRWIKGYMQTYLVTLRHPLALSRQGIWRMLSFHLTVGGKAFSIFINPIFWTLTIGYIALRTIFGPVVEALFPAPLVYLGGLSLLVGNFLYFYSHMIGVAKTGQWWLVKYIFLVPFYWLLISVAGWMALWQLIVKPHYWEKTPHGLYVVRQSSSNPA